jgi:two-component system LytT family response regulator
MDAERSVLLPVSQVDWIEAANYYAVAHAGTRTHVLRDSLARLERSLGDRFVRIHRSTIVNLDRVVEFQRLFHGDFAVLLADGTDLKLSRTYRSLVEARLGRPI